MIDQTFWQSLRELLVRHEGCELKPYGDTRGFVSIGVGRNLDTVGITRAEAFYLLNNDISRVYIEAAKFKWFDGLSSVQKMVVISMIFNLGVKGFSKFTQMIAALAAGDSQLAAKEMMRSTWAEQVGDRALELSQMMAQN